MSYKGLQYRYFKIRNYPKSEPLSDFAFEIRDTEIYMFLEILRNISLCILIFLLFHSFSKTYLHVQRVTVIFIRKNI
jgi:hypothetical protein